MAAQGNMCLRKSQAFLQFYRAKSRQGGLLCLLSERICYTNNVKRNKLSSLACQLSNDPGLPQPTVVSMSVESAMTSQSSIRSMKTIARTPCIQFCSYSTHKTDSGAELTSEILKSKIGEPENKRTTEREETNEQTNKNDSKTDDKSKKKESWFSNKNAWKLGLIGLSISGIMLCGNLVLMWGVPLKDDEGNDIEDEFTAMPKWKGYPLRANREAHFFKKMIEEPSYKKLLPDPLKEPWYQPPYTLVLEMNGVLVHPDWTLGTGWRFKKRPGIQYFLQQVASPLFEIVIFTHEQGFTAFPIVDGLDPNGHITFRLFRDATRYMNGTHVKDLDNLNRDLSKVILIDCDPKAFQKHPRNALLLKKWQGTDGDTELIDLAAFLRTIAMSSVEDIRPVLEHYSQYDDPVQAFKENQRRLQGEQERKTSTTDQQDKSLTGFGRSFLKRR